MSDREILIDVLLNTFREEWYKENPYRDPVDCASCWRSFCEQRIKAMISGSTYG